MLSHVVGVDRGQGKVLFLIVSLLLAGIGSAVAQLAAGDAGRQGSVVPALGFGLLTAYSRLAVSAQPGLPVKHLAWEAQVVRFSHLRAGTRILRTILPGGLCSSAGAPSGCHYPRYASKSRHSNRIICSCSGSRTRILLSTFRNPVGIAISMWPIEIKLHSGCWSTSFRTP